MQTDQTRPRRAVIYLRISLDKYGDGLAVERQRGDSERIAKQRGWTVLRTYTDTLSASDRRKKRAGYNQMIADYRAGRFDALICWDLDRLTRQPRQLEDWIEAAEDRGLLVVTANGEADLSTDAGRLFARMKAAVARQEIERKSARQKSANLQRAESGQAANGGIRTLGYERGLTKIRQSEARQIRAGFSALLAGSSLRSIARTWNAAGFSTAHGGTWDASDVRVVLRNGRYAGKASYLGQELCAGKWTPLVKPEVFAATQSILDDPQRRTTPGGVRQYLLPNLVVCGLCGGKMGTGRTQRGKRTYRCVANRGHLSVNADPVDQYITGIMIEKLDSDDAADLLVAAPTVDTQSLRDEAAAQRRRLSELVDLHGDGMIDAPQLVRGTERARLRIRELTDELADAGRVDVLGPFIRGDAAGAWLDADLDTKRAVIDTLMTITLHSPGRGTRVFRPETVAIGWK